MLRIEMVSLHFHISPVTEHLLNVKVELQK